MNKNQDNCNCEGKKKNCRKKLCKILGWTVAGLGTLAGLYIAGKKGYLGKKVEHKLNRGREVLVVEETYVINPESPRPRKPEYRGNNWSKTVDHNKLNNK